jgi:uncharacterized Zn finger protein (UPF0148 family)
MMTAQDQREKSIKMIGDYLLKGWTLTDLGCSNCDTPLMRSRGGEIVCTFCCQNPVENPVVLEQPSAKNIVLDKAIDPKDSSSSDFKSNIKQKLDKISQDILLCSDYDQIKTMVDTANALIDLIAKSQQV